MNPDSILELLLLRAARAAFDDRYAIELAGPERQALEEAQALLQQSGRPDLHFAEAIDLLDRRQRSGSIDAAFAASVRCLILLDPDVAQVEGAEAARRDMREATRRLPSGRRRQQLRAMVARIGGAVQRRRQMPARALAFDRAAVRLDDHPRHVADVMVDLLLCGEFDCAQQVYLEARLTYPREQARELECLVHDDIDLAALTSTHAGPESLAGLDAERAASDGPAQRLQRQLRQHVCLREQAASRVFWRDLVVFLCGEVEANPGLDASDSAATQEALLDVLGELITRSWRVFQGSSPAELQAYLRGMLMQREWEAPRRMRMAVDPHE